MFYFLLKTQFETPLTSLHVSCVIVLNTLHIIGIIKFIIQVISTHEHKHYFKISVTPFEPAVISTPGDNIQ